MIVNCVTCGAEFEDVYRSWTCPHNAFLANDGNNNFSVHEEAHLNTALSYDADYFLNGKQTGKSLYEDYRWMPELTIPMAQVLVDYCQIGKSDRILDFGCARGYVVRALREIGFIAHGVDVSEWAIRNADDEVKPYVNLTTNSPPLLPKEFDWIIAKDVLEHIPYVGYTITQLMNAAAKGVFAVVPLSPHDNTEYSIEEYERDVTHIQRLTLASWVGMFMRAGWRVESAYRVPGIKDNYFKPGWECGNGFITARRVKE